MLVKNNDGQEKDLPETGRPTGRRWIRRAADGRPRRASGRRSTCRMSAGSLHGLIGRSALPSSGMRRSASTIRPTSICLRRWAWIWYTSPRCATGCCRMTERLQRFGYVQVEDRTGLCFPAHEFHHAAAEPLEGACMAYNVRKAGAPQKPWACGFERKRTLAAFAHAYFLSHPELVRRFWG